MSRATEFPEDEEGGSSRVEPEEGERAGLKLPGFSPLARVRAFYHSIVLEMRKTSWPTRNEVWSTTVVVLIAVVFFGFYLWGVDLLVTLGFDSLKKIVE
jgi:preprotein translocase subunit SecE